MRHKRTAGERRARICRPLRGGTKPPVPQTRHLWHDAVTVEHERSPTSRPGDEYRG
ncbi:hypothetical protein BD310DRAFT_697942 [Dichomitus squalens]|uniref:Uncharacterized protein n=1 Tax=Dichomitus squalens TaxID=114155 RepID=A0A4Q9Q6R4_9APHY|nr:hypothetical protein BD310DRAFT_697942 [Dichomitus squalens]